MAEKRMCILQVSTSDGRGGAEKVAYNLHRAYQVRGYSAWLAVGHRQTDDPNVLVIPNDAYRNAWARFWLRASGLLNPLVGRVKGAGRARRWVTLGIGQPRRWWRIHRGQEDFDYPATWYLLEMPPDRPDIVHCHNLHGDYFDLRALPWLSQQVPVVLTLHDAWLLSGHCAHSFDCERWKTGCGNCPDLTIYPVIRRDATAYNWRRKRDIYARSRLYVATPSHWLMRKVEQSMLAPAIQEARVIPYGIDLLVFHPAEDRNTVRASLGIPSNAKVLLFASNGIRRSIWRDFQMMRLAVAMVAERLQEENVLFLALGEDAPPERIGRTLVQFVPYQKDPVAVARYYQAADVYVHAARADTFPNVVLEALACGTPVVATGVGGIPEQVKGLKHEAAASEHRSWSPKEATGVLVPLGNAEAMVWAIVTLLTNEDLRKRLGENAAKDAREKFNLQRQVEAYLGWYEELIEKWERKN